MKYFNDVYWLNTLPVVGQPIYPVIFDIAELTKAKLKTNLISSTCSEMARSYEELLELGLVGKSDMRIDDMNQYNYFSMSYILGKLSVGISSLGNNFGIIIHNSDLYDDA
ncbi:MAG TPA: hypothetical protein VLA74_03635, partial [Nitrososphaeraceae archaeon]|nr:hypothetical protein [Nitrososphaeraceae archaeon]